MEVEQLESKAWSQLALRCACRSDARILTLMGVTDSPAQFVLQLAAVQDHLVVVYGSDGGQGYREVTGTLDIDHDLHAAGRMNFAYGAECFVPVMNEDIETLTDGVAHTLLRRFKKSRPISQTKLGLRYESM